MNFKQRLAMYCHWASCPLTCFESFPYGQQALQLSFAQALAQHKKAHLKATALHSETN